MKTLAAIALIALTTTPALAQTAPTAPAAPAAATAAGKLSLDTPIETIVADPKGKAVIDADLPSLTSHPAYDQFKGMSLKALQPLSNGALSDDLLKKVATDLAAIK